MIQRALASIVRVTSLTPIAGADRVELARVAGWQCVVKKGEFVAGDLEIDAVPPEHPAFYDTRTGEHLGDEALRAFCARHALTPVPIAFQGERFDETVDSRSRLPTQTGVARSKGDPSCATTRLLALDRCTAVVPTVCGAAGPFRGRERRRARGRPAVTTRREGGR